MSCQLNKKSIMIESMNSQTNIALNLIKKNVIPGIQLIPYRSQTLKRRDSHRHIHDIKD